MLTVTLSREEVARAERVGQARIAMAEVDPSRFAYKPGRNGPDTHTLGALAELAASKAIGIPWPERVEDFGLEPDLPPHWEVRWSPDAKKVRVTDYDKPDALVCHVTGGPRTFEIHGYIVAGAVQARPLEGGKRSHSVDARRLVSIDEGFHELCGWICENGIWTCAHCGVPFE